MDLPIILLVLLIGLIWNNLPDDKKPKTPFSLKIEELFGIDLRSLALFRICLSLFLIGDLIIRAGDLVAFYTDDGVLPRILSLQYLNPWNISLHLLNGTKEWQIFLFLLNGFFLVLLLFGYKTRFATFMSWLFFLSINNRNVVITDAGDQLVRLILFWSMFLPLGACYSIESALNSSTKKLPERILSFGTVGYFAQVIFLYWFSVVLKLQNKEWMEGTAVYFVLNLIPYTTELGTELLKAPLPLIKLLTQGVSKFEEFGPLLLFCPVFTGPVRTLTIIAFLIMHTAFGLCIDLENFPYIDAITLLPFIPSWLWNKIFLYLRTPERLGAKIYFDGDCNFCKKLALIIKTFFLLPETQIIPAQTDPSINQDMLSKNSWVFVDNKQERYFKFNAFKALSCVSPILVFFTPLFKLKLVGEIGNFIYERIASNRSAGGKITALLLFRPQEVNSFKLSNVIGTFFLVYIFVWNMWIINPKYKMPDDLVWIGNLLRIDQRWGMFISTIGWYSGWNVYPGKLKDGTEVDIFKNGASVDWEKPKHPYKLYKNRLWRRYIINVLTDGNYQSCLPYYSWYLCKEWNSRHKDEKLLEELELYFMQWEVLPDFSVRGPDKKFIWRYQCFEKEKSASETVQELETKFSSNKPSALMEVYRQASIALSKGKFNEAEILYRKTLEIQEELFGKKHPSLIPVLSTLSTILISEEKYKEAEEINNRVKTIRTGNIENIQSSCSGGGAPVGNCKVK